MRVYLLALKTGLIVVWPAVALIVGGLVLYGGYVSQTALKWPYWVGGSLLVGGFVYIAGKASGLSAFGAPGGPIDGGGCGGGSD